MVQIGVAQTGVVGLLRGGASQPGAKTLAIRADMDALPIYEVNELDYRSSAEGKMLACGHDGHTAIALAVAALLSKRQAELTGTVKFLFQILPALSSPSSLYPSLALVVVGDFLLLLIPLSFGFAMLR
jgi:amidohydrolase